jgi:DNA-binding NtrC family response regulator
MAKTPARILIVDDEKDVAQSARVVLRQQFESVFTEDNPQKTLFIIKDKSIDVVLLDMNFTTGVTKGSEGLFWLKQITQDFPNVSVIMITAYGDVKLAVEAMKTGATDFVVKPWDNDKLIATVNSALNLTKSKRELAKLKSHNTRLGQVYSAPEAVLIGESPAMMEVRKLIDKVSRSDANVLLLGENGTGKELVAKSIHERSPRNGGPFIKVDIGTIPATLFESELFGHRKGAFTDARADHVGRFELASNGTLFLDEIGNLPLQLQIKLLSVLQNREFIPVGASESVSIDIRLISATNQALNDMISAGAFREDLLYRLNTIEITIPPLRERGDDVPVLLDHFMAIYSRKYGKKLAVDDRLVRHLKNYLWPGNVRELQHATERAVIMCENHTLTLTDFLVSEGKRVTKKVQLNLDEMERLTIQQAIAKHEGNLSKAALELGLGRATLYRKIKKFEL